MDKVVIDSPIYLRLSKNGKKYPLNLNAYRNNHHRINASLKKTYHALMIPMLSGFSFENKIKLEFKVFYASRRRADRSNVCCIVDKFFSDSLVEARCIEDDNDSFIESSLYVTGGVDKENPRCEVTIIGLEK